MKKFIILLLVFLALIPSAFAREDYTRDPWYATEQPLFGYAEELIDPPYSFSVVLYNDGRLIYKQNQDTLGEYKLDKSIIDAISTIIDKADLSAIPKDLYNGSVGGGFNSFFFKEKYISSLNISLSNDDSIYVADEYKDNRKHEQAVLNVFNKIRKAFKDGGYDLSLHDFSPIK
ncbi:MAG: hypothetical protein GYA87_04845 [Christensenellaceae bacterium]|nr:hypothetical protein [Christensenellaceae bacterium]